MSFVNVLRARDLLTLQFEFINLAQSPPPGAVLRREAEGPAFIIVRLPPQHVSEEAFGLGENVAQPRKAFLASPSRMAFRFPADRDEIPFRIEDLLRLIGEIEPLPLGEGPGSLIEFPDRILLAPGPLGRLSHRFGVPTVGACPIWCTELRPAGNGASAGLAFTAVPNKVDQSERLTSGPLRLQDRLDIGAQCQANPLSILAERFTLSPLGSTAVLRSNWPPSEGPTLSAWVESAVLGRDNYVRTVREGFLFPFGHRASKGTITERAFSSPFADLRSRDFVTVQEIEKCYDSRAMPFKRVRIASPPIRFGQIAERDAYRLAATMTDQAGTTVNCELVMVFVTRDDARDSAVMADVASQYAAGNHGDVALNQQRLVLADDSERRGGTELNVAQIRFAESPASGPSTFMPRMETALVRIPALEHLQGAAVGAARRAERSLQTIRHAARYLDQGLSPGDPKQVFAELVTAVPGISIPASRAGGLVAPTFPEIDGLSAVVGPVSGVREFLGEAQTFDPLKLVGETKLLGSIALKHIIDGAVLAPPGELLGNPDELVRKLQDDANSFLVRPVMSTVRSGSSIVTRFAWKPKIADAIPDIVPIEQRPAPAKRIRLVVIGSIRTTVDGGSAPALEVRGWLTDFRLSLGGLVTIDFNRLEFFAPAHRKMEATTDIEGMAFQGALTFAEEIRAAALSVRAPGGTHITPQPQGVIVSYGLALPAVPMGLATLQNVAFNSSLSLPFLDGTPASVRFSLSERANPFMVSVAPFGGTGFFALELRTDGHVLVEAAIEFGGILSINLLGIVRGGVYMLAGVYLAISSDGPPAITAHLRLGGYVDVLGLVSVSIEFYLALEYKNDELAGAARLTIGIRVLFFSETFTFEVRKKVPHLGAIPVRKKVPHLGAISRERSDFSFIERSDFSFIVDEGQWQSYCRAFA